MACIETFALGTLIYEMLKQGVKPTEIHGYLRARDMKIVIAQLRILGAWGPSLRSRFTRSLLSKVLNGLYELLAETDANLVARKEAIVQKYYRKPNSVEELSQLLASVNKNNVRSL